MPFHFNRIASACCIVSVLLAFAVRGFAQVAPPPAFYDAAIGKTGAALKTTLNSLIKNHTVLPYTSTSTDTWDALKVLDEAPGDPTRVVLVYSGLTDLKSAQFNGSTGTWDREHLWPQSFGLVALSADSKAKTDVFNLRPCDVNVNASRGNKYYEPSTSPISFHPEAGQSSYDSNSWEPRDADKGEIARSMFYMAVRYNGSDADVPDLELSDTPNAAAYVFGKLSTLLAWNRQFPVSDAERQRNQIIYTQFQYNRNPFIDRADYADMVFLGLPPYAAWKNGRFSSQELLDASISGDMADADRDGSSNLVEYTLHTDVRRPNQTPVTVVAASQGSVSLVFPRNRNASDVVISYEGATSLGSWAPITPISVTAVVADYETEQVTVRVTTSTPTFFVRLRVTKN